MGSKNAFLSATPHGSSFLAKIQKFKDTVFKSEFMSMLGQPLESLNLCQRFKE
jgi:hypothetical protein